MHETQLAKSILDVVLQHAHANGGSRVIEVRGHLAEAEALSADSLRFHFQAHARGTLAEDARMELTLEQLQATCASCGEVFAADHHWLICPRCGGTSAQLCGQAGLRIDSIQVA